MQLDLTTDLRELLQQLDAADDEARRVLDGLANGLDSWRPRTSSWSVAQCLGHLAITNRLYLQTMTTSAERARQHGSRRTKPARPGWIGRWFVRMLEPPVHPRMKVATKAVADPEPTITGEAALAEFLDSQQDVRQFIARYAEIELASVRFVNPFVPGVRFSLATGLHVIPAHNRRHFWQAWQVRRLAEASTAE